MLDSSVLRAVVVVVAALFLLGGLTAIAIRRRQYAKNPAFRPCLAEETFRVNLSVDGALQAGSAAFNALHPAAKSVDAHGPTEVRAKVGFSWRSFGELVAIHAVPCELRGSELTVSSWSTQPYTVLDWGKNRRNVSAVAHRLRAT